MSRLPAFHVLIKWTDCTIQYLVFCSRPVCLIHGQGYSEAKSVAHVGFLNYTLFIECPEFCTIYKLINVNNHQKYSDNIMLNVVDYILYRFGDRGNIERL